ncbi:MAG: SDR family NAD(P)-dependent oxidoreductase [Anaerolineae bacterium]
MHLEGERIVITGASSGIGRALLDELSRRPVQVVAVGRDEARLADVVAALAGSRARVLPFRCDVAVQEEVDALFAYAVEQMGGIDLFFANAGFAYWEPIGAPDWSGTEAIFRTNVISPIYAVEKMAALFPGGAWRVVITSSILGRVGLEGYGRYSATKAALDRFAEVYRLENRGRGRLVMVYPLAVRSRFFRAAGGAPVPLLSQSPEAAAQRIVRGIEKGRETIYGSWILPPMLLIDRLLPFLRRWYQAFDAWYARRQRGAGRDNNE